jgi:hypothetical protein
VLYPIFDKAPRRIQQWENLIEDVGAREMESGLVRLVWVLLLRMRASIGGDPNQLIDYVVNNATAWSFPEVENEDSENRERAFAEWEHRVAMLDTAILSLIGESDIPSEETETALDDILKSSLWNRRILRQNEQIQQLLKAGLVSRSRLIWRQSTAVRRRGYFLAGVGLATGHALDEIAADANLLLIQANAAILEGNAEAAINAITALAERVFSFHPFAPDTIPENWRDILRAWLLGQPLAGIAAAQETETLQFIEGGIVYRLPWAMEAVRVRAIANRDAIGDFLLDDYELGFAVPAVETGTLNRSASLLIQAGFNSRLAAIKAVTDSGGTFQTGQELRQWLNSEVVAAWSAQPDWPTSETKMMWTDFVQSFAPSENRVWDYRRYWANVAWFEAPLPPGTPVQIHYKDGQLYLLSADGTPIGIVQSALNSARIGLVRAQVAENVGKIDITYLGPNDLATA